MANLDDMKERTNQRPEYSDLAVTLTKKVPDLFFAIQIRHLYSNFQTSGSRSCKPQRAIMPLLFEYQYGDHPASFEAH